MASSLRCYWLVQALLLSYSSLSYAQNISTSTAIPPLQWINLTGYLQGPAAPPLMDASIGYDNITRNLLIFGGESEGGFAQSGTYLLNLDTLVWTKPNSPANLQTAPSARSAALSGDDFAASNRHAHVLIGGRNANTALSDVWEFDYINEFWAEVNISPGGPSPRWGASGGIDTQVSPINDPSGLPGPNNTVYLAGGTDGNGPIAISDVWELHLSGILSSNLPNSSVGSWQYNPIGQLPALDNQAGTIVGGQIVAAGGCHTTLSSNDSCASQGTYVLNAGTNMQISPGPCPAPRFGAALAQNFNGFSSGFSSQIFLLLGTFNSSMWDDGGGLQKGEVSVLDINAGTWSRVLPSGDPGTSGNIAFPSPREGAAVLSFSSNLVGNTQTRASDTIIFGGRDESGKYLSEMWLLRAYNGAVASSNQKWSGFGNGILQTGVNANGAGVTLQYMTECASAISVTVSPTSTATSTPAAKSPAPGSQSTNYISYNVSTIHIILAPLSIGLLLLAIILLRFASPSTGLHHSTEHNISLLYLSAFVGICAYGLGIVGLVSSFTSIRPTLYLHQRSRPDLKLKTEHGKAGLVLFICLYGLVPTLYLLRCCRKVLHRRLTKDNIEKAQLAATPENSPDTKEKPALPNADSASITRSTGNPTPPSSPRRRVASWAGHTLWQGSRTQEPRVSSDTESTTSVVAQPRTFEVVNRPQRIRRSSGNANPRISRNLGDIDWLERRRSLNAVDELDYAMSQNSRTRGTTPATADMQSQLALMTKTNEPISLAEMPDLFDTILRILFHIFLLALSILALVALWSLTSRAGFAVFLICTFTFYVFLMLCSWYGRPRQSILTVIIFRLRASPAPATPSPLPLSAIDGYPFPTDVRGPYVHHQPPFHVTGTDEVSTTHGHPRSAENEDDDDADEDVRQQRIEDEMARRDVSIITVPRKKLWITNPESGDSS